MRYVVVCALVCALIPVGAIVSGPGPELGDCAESYLSTISNEFGGGIYVNQHKVYAEPFAALGPLSLFASFLPSGLGLDAFHVFDNGDVAFSTKSAGFVQFPGGQIYISPNLVYLYRDADGAIVNAPQGAGLNVGTLDALSIHDGHLLFSVAGNQFIWQTGGPVYVRQQNLYKYDPATLLVDPVPVFNGQAIGLKSLDGAHYFNSNRVAFSSASNQFIRTGAGSSYIYQQNAYVLAGGPEILVHGQALQLRSLDSFSLVIVPTFFGDADGDEFGDPDSSVQACEAPEGFVPDDEDCDDTDSDVNPAAAEICNGVDDDCDDVIDDLFPNCDDSVDCTVDTCEAGSCVNSTSDDLCAADDVGCTTETCDATDGCISTPSDDLCPANDVACTLETCDEDDGCISTPDDGQCPADDIVCTVATCDAELGCLNPPDDSLCPPDAFDCTTEICWAGDGQAIDDMGAGCVSMPNSELCPTDGIDCTAETCSPDVGCVSTPVDAQCPADDLGCTVEMCDPVNGCISVPDDALCPTVGGSECTITMCDPDEGCVSVADDAQCQSDGIDCTAEECADLDGCISTPDDSLCTPDAVDCTVESCDPSTGCISTPDDALCTPDAIDCTVESCDPSTGCISTPDDSLCMNDGFDCTHEVCDPVLGCISDPQDGECPQGMECLASLGCTEIADEPERSVFTNNWRMFVVLAPGGVAFP